MNNSNHINEAFVVYLTDFNSSLKIAKIITKRQGFIKVFINKKKYNKNLQVGSYINYNLIQKTPDSVFFLNFDIIENFINDIYFNKKNLFYFTSLTSIINKFFIYNENIENIYKIYKNIIFSFKESNNYIIYNYIDFLINIIYFFGINNIVLPNNFNIFEMSKPELKDYLHYLDGIFVKIIKNYNL